MLRFYRIWTILLHLLIGIQFFLAGFGARGTGSPDEAYSLHIMNGRVIAVVALLGILFAALARAGGKLVGMSAGVLGLVVLQSVIVLISVQGTLAGQLIFGLHVINAMAVMGVAEASGRLSKKLLEERRAPAAPEPAVA
jgi:hypothetical protein